MKTLLFINSLKSFSVSINFCPKFLAYVIINSAVSVADNKNFSEELSRIPSIFPPIFVEMEEDDYCSFLSFNFSRNYDNDLTNGNSIFNEENILFEKKGALII